METNKEQQKPVDLLMARVNQQKELFARQKQQLHQKDQDDGSSSSSDPFVISRPIEVSNHHGRPDAIEVFRLNKELELAKERMAQMELELTQSRIAKHTVEEAIGSPFPAAQHLAFNMNGPGMPTQTSFNRGPSPLDPAGHPNHGHGSSLRIDTRVPNGLDMFTPYP